MAKVKFPMYFEAVAYQEITLPDDVNIDDKEAVKDYIRENWDSIQLPPQEDWDYLPDSCMPDDEAPIHIEKD